MRIISKSTQGQVFVSLSMKKVRKALFLRNGNITSKFNKKIFTIIFPNAVRENLIIQEIVHDKDCQ